MCFDLGRFLRGRGVPLVAGRAVGVDGVRNEYESWRLVEMKASSGDSSG